MQFRFLISALALLVSSSQLVQADPLASAEDHQLEKRGGGASKALAIVGGIAATIGGILTLQPELVAYGAALSIIGSATGTVGAIISRRDLENLNLGTALVAAEPNLSLHASEFHPSGNWTSFVLSGRDMDAGNAVYMELTQYHKTNRVDGLIVGSKVGLSRRQDQTAQHIKFSVNLMGAPEGGYDTEQLNRFAKNMADSVAAAGKETSCHGSIVDGKAVWNAKISVGSLDDLKTREVVNDCTQDPAAYQQYFDEQHVAAGSSFVGGSSASFLAIN
ncbi:hypothetical protein HDU97_004577 [Phlyctochytrium planicorne]|nr:hypothetical protein HDU97_004577 [Phlyctochytrium planicorne]